MIRFICFIRFIYFILFLCFLPFPAMAQEKIDIKEWSTLPILH